MRSLSFNSKELNSISEEVKLSKYGKLLINLISQRKEIEFQELEIEYSEKQINELKVQIEEKKSKLDETASKKEERQNKDEVTAILISKEFDENRVSIPASSVVKKNSENEV